MADMFDRLRAMTIRNLKPRSSGGKGEAGTLVRKERVYDEETDLWVETPTTHDISGLRATYKLFHTDGTLIRASDVKFYLCPEKIDGSDCPTPLTIDKVITGGKTYTVISVKTWNNSGVDCGWELQLRTV